MGILDSKTRLFDTILTNEGRKQMAEGHLKAKYYSFSDYATIYNQDTIVSGGLNETYRFILEATGLPQDTIIFKTDDNGKLASLPFSGSDNYTILQGQVFSGTVPGQRTFVSSSDFLNVTSTLLSNSINAFKNQMILKSPDPLDDKKVNFVVSPTTVSFSISTTKPFSDNEISEASINHIESLFFDKRLSHVKNFQFLPPKNKPNIGQSDGTLLGNYINISQEPIIEYNQLENELVNFDKQIIYFSETSTNNNIFGQFFEINSNFIKKLDIIDFGSFTNPNGGEPLHVFFVGKTFIDDLNTHTFVNMFTLVFE